MVGVIILGVSAALLNDAFFNFLPPVTVAGAADALLTHSVLPMPLDYSVSRLE